MSETSSPSSGSRSVNASSSARSPKVKGLVSTLSYAWTHYTAGDKSYALKHNADSDNSGSEKLSPPPAWRARVPGPLVEAVVAVLPELDRVGREQIAAPPRGAWDLVARQEALELGLEFVAA